MQKITDKHAATRAIIAHINEVFGFEAPTDDFACATQELTLALDEAERQTATSGPTADAR